MGGIYFLYQNSRIEFLAEANRHYKREQLLNWVIDLVLRKRIQCKILVHRLANNGDVVAFKMGCRQGARRAHI